MKLLLAYDRMIIAAPFRTKLASSVVIFGFCEWNSQLITAPNDGGTPSLEERLASIDYQQVLGYISFSLFNTYGCLAPPPTCVSVVADSSLFAQAFDALLLLDF